MKKKLFNKKMKQNPTWFQSLPGAKRKCFIYSSHSQGFRPMDLLMIAALFTVNDAAVAFLFVW